MPPSKTSGPAVDWKRVRELFDACSELDHAARSKLIDTRCADDPALRAAVESLLRSHDGLTDTRADRLARGIDAGVADIWSEAKPGQHFGAFRVVQEIARGGMGVVYLAERADDTVAQRVALKIVGNAHLGADATRRLARERRLLAALEHPHIARLIDAGTNAAGTAYFAMEYVQGSPITRYCDERALPIAQRLRLFIEVCTAVQHAHANLVVHRDLKAANILIREDGLPKLLDFGIATTLEADDGAMPGQGNKEHFLSPHVAAPEQFLGQDTGIAIDIYALGVLLCELAGGSRPIDLTGADADEMARRVLHQPPRLPSGAIDAVAAQLRGSASATRLRRRLAGDIDAIVDCCLAKRPQARYASAARLAEDVERHLRRQPISIRAGERRYRAQRFLQRNALSVSLAFALAFTLGGFALFGVLSSHRLAHERDQAMQREHQAQIQRARAQQVTDFLVGLFRASTPEQRRGHDISARDLLERGRSQLDADLRQQPDLRASMLAVLSDVYLALDDLDGAERMARQASALREQALPTVADDRFESLRQLARLDNRRGRPDQALQRVAQARALGEPPGAAERAELLRIEALALEGLGKPKDATLLWRQALALENTAFGEEDVRTLRTTMSLATNLGVVGLPDDAERLLAESLPRARHVLAPDDPVLGETLRSLAIHARNKGDYRKAEALADEALGIYLATHGEDSSQAANAMNTVATIAQANGQVAKARLMFERALAVKRVVYGDTSKEVATAEYNLGLLLQLRTTEAQQALLHLQAANAIGSRILPAGHGSLANYRLALGSTLRELGRHADADTVLRQALSAFEAANAPGGVDKALACGELACNALAHASDAAPLRQLEDAIALLVRQAPDDPQVQRVRACALPGAHRMVGNVNSNSTAIPECHSVALITPERKRSGR